MQEFCGKNCGNKHLQIVSLSMKIKNCLRTIKIYLANILEFFENSKCFKLLDPDFLKRTEDPY